MCDILSDRTGSPAGPPLSVRAGQGSNRVYADTMAILTRLARSPVPPAPHHELLADLGYDSMRVLELIGELEEHFDVSVPLNRLTHIRTVAHVMAEVERLVGEQGALE